MRRENDKISGNEIGGLKCKCKLYIILKNCLKKIFWSELIEGQISSKNMMKNKNRNFQKVKRKTKYTWTEEDLENAMHEVLSIPGTPIRGAAKKFEMEESTLSFWLKKTKANEPLLKVVKSK